MHLMTVGKWLHRRRGWNRLVFFLPGTSRRNGKQYDENMRWGVAQNRHAYVSPCSTSNSCTAR